MSTASRVMAEALQLSDDERFEMACRLLESCDEPDAEWWATIEPEMKRRVDAVLSGEAKATPSPVARERLRERLSAHRD